MKTTKPTPRVKPWWIKERFNPQLGTYFVMCGQMSKTAAKKYERPLYGNSIMHRFETADDAEVFAADLKRKGCRVHE